MDYIQSILLFLAISLVVDILASFKVEEPEGEHATGTYGMAIGILRRPDLPAELRELMLEGLNLFEYAEYLSYDPQTAQSYRLSKDREVALFRLAHVRIQELRDCNGEESITIGRIERAVCVIARTMGYSLVDYERADAEDRPLMVAQGMEGALATLSEISTKPFWLCLGIRAFIKHDDFPLIHGFLSQKFKTRYHRYMLRASALVDNVKNLEYLASPLVSWQPTTLRKLLQCCCRGGGLQVFNWVILKCPAYEHKIRAQALRWTVMAGQIELLAYLMTKYAAFHNDIFVDLALLAVGWGKLAILKYLVNSWVGTNFFQNRERLNYAVTISATHGNVNILRYILELDQTPFPSNLVLKSALRLAVKEGNLEVLEYFCGIHGVVDGLQEEFSIFFASLFHTSVEKGHLHILRFLLSKHVDDTPRFPQVDVVYRENCALMHAARWGLVKIVQYLLMLQGTDKKRFQQIDLLETNHFALCHAIKYRHENIIHILFRHVDVKIDPNRIFRACCHSGNVGIIKAMSQMRLFNPTSFDAWKKNVKIACLNGHVRAVQYIFERLSSFNVIPNARIMNTFLKKAIHHGHLNVVRYLLQRDPDDRFVFEGIDLAHYGTELFVLAVANCHVLIAEFLLSIAQDSIDPRALLAIAPYRYMNHYSTALFVIKKLSGPCPFPANSRWEMFWALWKAIRQKLLVPSQPSKWNTLSRTTHLGWMHMNQVAVHLIFGVIFLALPNIVLAAIVFAPFFGILVTSELRFFTVIATGVVVVGTILLLFLHVATFL